MWAGTKPGDLLMSLFDLYRARMVTHMIPPRLTGFVDTWSRWKRENGLLDFTDLVDYCLREVDAAPFLPSAVFIDEAQDLSRLELTLIRKWGRAAGFLILAGDPDQSIFTWRGADPAVLTDPALPDGSQVTLRQSFRLPLPVHAKAVAWIDRILDRVPVEYSPSSHPGEVRGMRATWKNPAGAVADAEPIIAGGQTAMIIASCGHMLYPHHPSPEGSRHPLPQSVPARENGLEPVAGQIQRRSVDHTLGCLPEAFQVGCVDARRHSALDGTFECRPTDHIGWYDPRR